MSVIPLGNRILVKRRRVGEKSGSIYLPDETASRPTDIADVVYLPDLTFGDKEILDNAEEIVKSLTKKSIEGDSQALIALLRLNDFVKLKSLKVGDLVMISKYVGTDFQTKEAPEYLTIVNDVDIIGVIKEEAK